MSLTSRDARQAILSLGTTSPTVYAEIMASTDSSPIQDEASDESAPGGADLTAEPEGTEGDLDHPVNEVLSYVLAANTASEAATPLPPIDDFASGSESDTDSDFVEPAAALVSVTRSGRATRLSSRYSGKDWLCH